MPSPTATVRGDVSCALTPWRLLPAQQLGVVSDLRRRLTEWATAGVFDQLHIEVLDRLGERGQVDWSRASVDTMTAGQAWGDQVGANPSTVEAWKQAPPGLDQGCR